VDDDHGVARVVLAGEHVAELQLADLLFDPVERGVEVGDERFVFEFSGDLDLLASIAGGGAELIELLDPGFVLLQLLDEGVGRFLVVPEIGRCRNFLQVAYFFFAFIDVKDTPVTGSGGAQWRAGDLFLGRTWS
jgi:hypothetical protein